ncbi:MAG: hypothetical protein AB7F98_15760 [Novosphingobium sp.]
MSLLAIAPLTLAGAAFPSLRQAAEPAESRWAVIDRVEADNCDMTVTGDGRVFLFTVTGLNPNIPARYRISNGDMKPIDWRVSSDSSGSFARYYMPFRWHRPGGTVTVSLSSASCTISSSFDWRRSGALVR